MCSSDLTGERALTDAPGVLLLQAAWTAAIVGLGLLLWRSNQKKLVLQGG